MVIGSIRFVILGSLAYFRNMIYYKVIHQFLPIRNEDLEHNTEWGKFGGWDGWEGEWVGEN